MGEPRGHHLLATVYQRGFARQHPGGRALHVRIVRRSDTESSVRSIEKNFKERDWNSVSLVEDGPPDVSLEKLLADRVDTPAAPAFRALRQLQVPLSDDDRIALSGWMSAQMQRGRAPRETWTENTTQLADLVLRTSLAHGAGAVDGKEEDDAARAHRLELADRVSIRPSKAMLLRTLFSTVPKVLQFFANRTWTVVAFDEPWLFSGESPVAIINPGGSAVGNGLMTAEQLYLPLSPTAGLLMSHPWTAWPEGILPGTRDLAERLNWAILSDPANEWFLLHPDTEHFPLPGIQTLSRDARWPWPSDPLAMPVGFYAPGDPPAPRGPRGLLTDGPPTPPWMHSLD